MICGFGALVAAGDEATGAADAFGAGDTFGATGAAVALGSGCAIVTVFGCGATQSSGCTSVSPVVASYLITRTPDALAHSVMLASSDPAKVML